MIPKLLSFLRKHTRPVELTLTTRLPEYLLSPCIIQCAWILEEHPDHTRWTFTLDTTLTIQCQRCANTFTQPFHHQNSLMICKNDAILERYQAHHDCLLMDELPSELEPLIVDELHLFAPDRHEPACPKG